ncbi:MAG: HepT-like ribonuclease domain-containing protein [Planctomycetota bacterium]
MPKDDLVYTGHMLDMARKAVEMVAGMERAEFDADEVLHMALAHTIQIVGEAASRVSQEYQHRHARIPWRAIIGMRHKIVHDYMNLKEDVLWDVVMQDLQPLIAMLEKIVPAEEA